MCVKQIIKNVNDTNNKESRDRERTRECYNIFERDYEKKVSC